MEIPYLPYDRIRPIAEQFLKDHNSEGDFPIPIERIVDNCFEIDIVPTPGLHQHFDIDSYITSDFAAIHVDEYVYDSRPTRYRFSLAHELSHFILHQDVFSQLSFASVSEWREVVTSIPPKEYRFIEFQANSLAGLILVPPDKLAELFDDAARKAGEAGLDVNDPPVTSGVEEYIAKDFNVSSAVIHRRLEYDGLIRK